MEKLNEYNIPQLQNVLALYPYFSYARALLITKIAGSDKEAAKEELRKSSAFIHSLKEMHSLITSAQPDKNVPQVAPFESIQEAMEEAIQESISISNSTSNSSARGNEAEVEKEQPKYILVGADYFSAGDLQTVKSEPFKVEKWGKIGGEPAEKDVEMSNEASLDLDLSDFYTETLAKIYAEQGYYQEAIKVYSKLILLYPEKSAYFASLVNDLKLKNS